MTNVNPIPPAQPGDLNTLSRKVASLDAEMQRHLRSTRSRNHSVTFFSVITIVAVVIYLVYAYYRFGNEVTPDLVAYNLQGQFQQMLPDARQQLQENLKSNAPHYVDDALNQLQNVPMQFADRLHDEASAALDKDMTSVQDELYQAMKSALDNAAKQNPSGGAATDQQRMQSALDAVATTYGTETTRLVDQVHRDYAADATSFIDYLDHLAGNQGLDHRDQLYRRMFRTMFMLVRERANGPAGAQMNSTLDQPAGAATPR